MACSDNKTDNTEAKDDNKYTEAELYERFTTLENQLSRFSTDELDKKNSALYLLNYMLSNNYYTNSDTITLAFSAANAWIYEIGKKQ